MQRTQAYQNQSAIYLFICIRVQLIAFNVNVDFDIFLAGVQILILLTVNRRFHQETQCVFTPIQFCNSYVSMQGKNCQLSVIKKHLHNHWLMLQRRCSNVVATSWQRRATTTLSQRRKVTSPQLSFSTLPQCCDNVNHDVVTTLS